MPLARAAAEPGGSAWLAAAHVMQQHGKGVN